MAEESRFIIYGEEVVLRLEVTLYSCQKEALNGLVNWFSDDQTKIQPLLS